MPASNRSNGVILRAAIATIVQISREDFYADIFCPGGEVKVNLESDERSVAFSVWNRQFMPDDIARRIFQGHFSTKREAGRGLGTYAMRLIGERYLKGRVDFTTSEQEGTWFRIALPR